MDLRSEVERLRLDLLAVEISNELQTAGVPHIVLKGPSTANWLYVPARRYRDVDVLVPRSRLEAAIDALERAGVARPCAGEVGEEAEHSLLMLSGAGYEVDLHISLPTVPPAGDQVWDVLAPHVEMLDLGVGTVPALDEPGRCLVLALHALNNNVGGRQAVEDLIRARMRADSSTWIQAEQLARELAVEDLFTAGLGLVEPNLAGPPMSTRAALRASGAPSAALGFQRLSDAKWSDLPRLTWRELMPSRGFMRRAYPSMADTRVGLARAHVRRWYGIVRQLGRARRAWRAAGRRSSGCTRYTDGKGAP
jgi:hypothetical protein